MQPSSGNPRAWPHWPCAAATALLVVTSVAFANGGSTNGCNASPERGDTGPQPFKGSVFNQCNADTVNFSGTQREQTRTDIKRDCSSESRVRVQTEGEGTGIQAEYRVREDQTTVTRLRPDQSPSRIKEHLDHRIIAQRETPVGRQTDLAASMFFTSHSETRPDDPRHNRTHSRCRCKREDGTDSCPNGFTG